MIYLLLMLFPLAMAGGSFVVRRATRLTGSIGVATIAIELWLALTAAADQPARLLAISMNYTTLGRLFLAAFCIAGLIATLAATSAPYGEYFIATTLLILSGSAAILIVQEPFVVAALLLLTSLIGGIQLVDQPADSPRLIRPQTLGTALKYTLLVTLGGLLLLLGFIIATAYERQLATTGAVLTHAVFGLLLVGFGLRLGLIPFHLWLPDVLEETAPPTLSIHAGWLTVLALPVLLVALQTQPQLIVGNPGGQRLLLGLGALSAIAGGGLALITTPTRRAIAFVTIANLGLLTIGLSIGTIAGVSAALLGAINHVIGIALMMLGLTLLERPVPGRREQAGALRERPLAALAFLLGVLVLIGVPPLSGFAPRLLLIAASHDATWVVGLIIVVGLLLIASSGARLIGRTLLTPPDAPATRSLLSADLERLTVAEVPYAPWPLRALILLLAVGSVVAGVWPQPIMHQLDAAVRALSFLAQQH